MGWLILVYHQLFVPGTLTALSARVAKILADAADLLTEDLSDLLNVLGYRHLI